MIPLLQQRSFPDTDFLSAHFVCSARPLELAITVENVSYVARSFEKYCMSEVSCYIQDRTREKSMRFSEVFGITRGVDDDWFDPHLLIDTKLFIDPLLLMLEVDSEWDGAHDELIEHFIHCYELIAKGGSRDSLSSQAAIRLLYFPEPTELSLGYTASGTSGSGGAGGMARQIADGIAVAIAAGLDVPEHIEEIGILNEGIGADRISDAVANVLKARFVKYTQAIAQRHGIDMNVHRLRNVSVNMSGARWMSEDVLLPTNPNTGGAIVLVPNRFLNTLPHLNADEWFESPVNEDIRLSLNLNMGEKLRKRDIVKYARKHPERVRAWAQTQTSQPNLSGYNFTADPRGVVQWDGEPAAFARAHPIAGDIGSIVTQDQLRNLLEAILDQFKRFLEEQRGWSLLFNSDGTEKPEEALQLILLGVAQPYLRQFGVEMDREVELGRGPVDFKVSSGASLRILIEAKKAHNGRFWNGLTDQLPSYLVSDDALEGWYLAVRYRNNKASENRMRELPGVVARVAEESGKVIKCYTIDARPKESASKL